MTTKTYLAKVALALTLWCILVGTFSVKAFGFDADTTTYLNSLDKRIVSLEKTADLTDWKAQNKINELYGIQKSIEIDYGQCPLRFSTSKSDKNYCNTWFAIKKKPLYPFLYGFAKK